MLAVALRASRATQVTDANGRECGGGTKGGFLEAIFRIVPRIQELSGWARSPDSPGGLPERTLSATVVSAGRWVQLTKAPMRAGAHWMRQMATNLPRVLLRGEESAGELAIIEGSTGAQDSRDHGYTTRLRRGV